MYIQKTLTHYW